MEIREGIKYQPKGSTEIFKVVKDPNSNHRFCGEFTNGSLSCSYNPGDWRKDFKSGSLKLIEYPYKVGDWVYCIDDTWSLNSPQITQVTDIRQGTEALIYVNNENTYQKFYTFNDCYRPCFKHEIPTNTNQVIVENMDYLIPFIDKLNEKRI